MTDIKDRCSVSPILRAIRGGLDLTQEKLAERLGVSFATVSREDADATMPQKAARTVIAALVGLT